jgi:uncharacterized protein YbjT (DUF2867 family)
MLKKLGIEITKGDFNDISTLERAMKGVDAVFAMGVPFEKGVEIETKNGMSIVDTVKNLGIKHLVYSSVGSANRNTGIAHFESKFKVEQYIGKIQIPFTIVSPVYFMENLYSPWTLPGIKEGRLASLLPPDRNLQMISVKDIASFVVYIMERREEFLNKRLDIASDDISGYQSAKILSKVLMREIIYNQLSYDQVKNAGEDYIAMYKWFNDIGYNIDISSLRSTYPEIKWHRFEEWVEEQDWSILDKQIQKLA